MLVAIDIGNVCLELHIAEAVEKLGIDPTRDFPAEIRSLCSDYAVGAVSSQDFLHSMAAFTGLSELQVKESWESEIGTAIPGMDDAIRKCVANGVEFVFLSDTNDLHMTKIRRTLSFVHLVKGAILSQEVGATKPSPEIYSAFEKKYGKPDLYFDDLQKNIDGAIRFGWDAVRFTGPDDFYKHIEAKRAGRR